MSLKTNKYRFFSQVVSWVSLIILAVFAGLYLSGAAKLENVKAVFWVVTIVWFISASLWMWRNNSNSSNG